MPHIVLENANNTKEAFEAVSPFAQKIEGGILKVTDKYINGFDIRHQMGCYGTAAQGFIFRHGNELQPL